MITRYPDQRIAVLIDVQNLYYSAKNLFGSRVNFAHLLDLISQDRKLVRAIAYVINTEDEANSEFIEALANSGFDIKEKKVQTFADGRKKGDWDVGIAMDAIRLGHKVDSIVLVSWDGDYRPVVSYLQQSHGCLVEVMAFRQTANDQLMELADDFVDIEHYKKELLFHTKASKSSSSKTNRKAVKKSPKK